jgi:hypothetical protein
MRAEKKAALLSLLRSRLTRYAQASQALRKAVEPAGVALRPRAIQLDTGDGRDTPVLLPGEAPNGYAQTPWGVTSGTSGDYYPSIDYLADVVLGPALTPRRALRWLRRIDAATAWCAARIAGLERHEAEIERQQARLHEVLDAELALDAMERRP